MKRTGLLSFGATMMCLVLSGCAAATVEPAKTGLAAEPVRVAVDDTDPMSEILGLIYTGTLQEQGRVAELAPLADANFIPGCTGKFLWEYDPQRAATLADEIQDPTYPHNPNVATHEEMMGALPPELTTNDPSGATWCTDFDDVELPLDIVPIYEATLLNREERFEVTKVTKYLTNDDLEQLVESAAETGAEDAVAQWLETSVAGGNLDAGNAVSDNDDS